jgi:hypothetical protein
MDDYRQIQWRQNDYYTGLREKLRSGAIFAIITTDNSKNQLYSLEDLGFKRGYIAVGDEYIPSGQVSAVNYIPIHNMPTQQPYAGHYNLLFDILASGFNLTPFEVEKTIETDSKKRIPYFEITISPKYGNDPAVKKLMLARNDIYDLINYANIPLYAALKTIMQSKPDTKYGNGLEPVVPDAETEPAQWLQSNTKVEPQATQQQPTLVDPKFHKSETEIKRSYLYSVVSYLYDLKKYYLGNQTHVFVPYDEIIHYENVIIDTNKKQPALLIDGMPLDTPTKDIFEQKLASNCVVSALIHKFSRNKNKNKSISPKKIISYFTDTHTDWKQGVQIEHLITFANKNTIGLTLYGINGQILYDTSGSIRNSNKDVRSANSKILSAIVYDNHFYLVENDIKTRVNMRKFHMNTANRQLAYASEMSPIHKAQQLTDLHKDVVNAFSTSRHINACYRWETDSKYKYQSISYLLPMTNYTSRAVANAGEFCYDLSSAYFQSLQFWRLGNNKLTQQYQMLEYYPVRRFQYVTQPYNGQPLVPHFTYFVSRNLSKSLYDTYGITTNKIAGAILMLIYENSPSEYVKTNITHFRPADGLPAREISRIINENNSFGEDAIKKLPKRFNLYAGIYGKTDYADKSYVFYQPDDVRLLSDSSKARIKKECRSLDSPMEYIVPGAKHDRYAGVYSLNVYEYIITAVQFAIIDAMKRARADGYTVIKSRCDDIIIGKPRIHDDFEWPHASYTPFAPGIKYKIKPNSCRGYLMSQNPLVHCDTQLIIYDELTLHTTASKNITGIFGCAGVGKTYAITHGQFGKYDYATAFTNVATNNMMSCSVQPLGDTDDSHTVKYLTTNKLLQIGYTPDDTDDSSRQNDRLCATTCRSSKRPYNFNKLMKRFNAKFTVWVDELSQLPSNEMSLFILLAMNGLKLIVSGDHRQLLGVDKGYLSYPVSMEDILAVKKAIADKRIIYGVEGEFSRCDMELRRVRELAYEIAPLEFCAIMWGMHTQGKLRQTELDFVKSGVHACSITMFKATRANVNKSLYKKYADTCIIGAALAGKDTQVVSATQVIKNKRVVISKSQCATGQYKLAYAATLHSSQGLTLSEMDIYDISGVPDENGIPEYQNTIEIMEKLQKGMAKRWLYTAVSRVKKITDLAIK